MNTFEQLIASEEPDARVMLSKVVELVKQNKTHELKILQVELSEPVIRLIQTINEHLPTISTKVETFVASILNLITNELQLQIDKNALEDLANKTFNTFGLEVVKVVDFLTSLFNSPRKRD